MAKNSGIRALNKLKNLNSKKNEPVLTRKVAVTREKEIPAASDAPEIISASYASEIFEDVHSNSYAQSETADSERRSRASAKPIAGRLNMSRGYRSKKKGLISKFHRLTQILLGKRSADNAALDFAVNHKRKSKRERRRRMIFVCAGSGVLVIVAVLLVVLVAGGQAASGQADEMSVAGESPSPQISMVADISGMNIKGGLPETHTATLPPDVSAMLTAPLDLEELETLTKDPAIDPTTEPTEESTPESTPKSTPESTPKSTPEETPITTTPPEETPPPITVDECVKYFVVEADAYYNDMGYSSNHYKYTEDDVYMLAQIIDIEARGESSKGKVAVGNVVMNRVLNRHQFPNTIEGVITAPGQFAWKPERSPSSSSKRAARQVLEDEYWVIPQDVYFFRSGASAGSDWGSHKFYTQIGGHCFYTHKYSGRNRGGEAPPKLFDRTFKYAQYGCKPEKRVYRIQYMLNKLGFDVKADRYFGQDTVDALKLFQESHGLEADGVAGPSTMKKLIKKFGLNKYYETFLAE